MPMTRLAAAALAAALALPAAAQTAAPTDPDIRFGPSGGMTTVTIEEFAAAMTEAGWTVEITSTGESPALVGEFKDDSGKSRAFSFGLYNCLDGGKCQEFSFVMTYESASPVTRPMINKYNAMAIIGTAYLQDDGKVGLSFGGSVRGGVSKGYLAEMVAWWRRLHVEFESTLAARNAPPQ